MPRRSIAGRLAALLAVALLPATAPLGMAAPVALDCTYPQRSDPRNGLGDADEPMALRFTIDREAGTARMQSGDFVADLELRFFERHLSLIQTTGNGSFHVTVIVFDAFDDSDLYRSVHSRHAMIGGLGELRASQYYGRCEPAIDSEGSDGR
ncbi:MAG: hypothetical protein V2I82_13890 [Halieaceae bacterium]|nr:hypothetical protein [Halieaceae bacterium]